MLVATIPRPTHVACRRAAFLPSSLSSPFLSKRHHVTVIELAGRALSADQRSVRDGAIVDHGVAVCRNCFHRMILFMTRFRLLGRYLQSLYALKYFIAILFAHMTGKHMEIGQLLNCEAAEAY